MKIKFINVVFLILILLVFGHLVTHKLEDSSATIKNDVIYNREIIKPSNKNSSIKSNNETEIIKPSFIRSSSGGAEIVINHNLVPDETMQARSKITRARRIGAIGKITFRIVDEEGKIVPDALVTGGLYVGDDKGSGFNLKTDEKGLVTIEGRCVNDLNCTIQKKGYYETSVRYMFPKIGYDCVQDGRWLPWNPIIDITLKTIRDPITMVVASYQSNEHFISNTNTYFGFDLELNDWIEPEGMGKYADFYVKFDWDGSKYANYKGSRLTLQFRDKYAGFVKFPLDKFSLLWSPHRIDETMSFSDSIEFEFRRNTDPSKRFDNRLNEEEGLLLRTRTKVDTSGNLISCNYSKIYGPLRFGFSNKALGVVIMTYYYNVTPNDTNLEANRFSNVLENGERGFRP